VPIAQENEPSNELYKVGTWSEITEQEYLAMLNPEPILPTAFEVAKTNKQNELNLFAYNFIVSGYLDTETNYKLFTSEKDITNYTVLLNSLQFENDNELIDFGTMLGWFNDTVINVKNLLERYSKFVRPITTKIMKLQTMIDIAQNENDIENIIIG
jgi:hypothetical protein